MLENKMTKKELQKKKSEGDFVVVVGCLFSFLMAGILVLQICAALMPQMSADATFTLYDVLQEIINHPPYQDGEMVSVRYSDNFQDGDSVSINRNPVKGIILLGILVVACCLGEVAAIMESSKLSKRISET